MSIKVGIISPVHNLEKFALQSRFHLILTHIALKSKKYVNFYKFRKKCGDYVVLDNSLFELEEAMDLRDVLKVADQIGVDEVVIPDVIYNGKATVEAAYESIENLRKWGYLGKYKIMAVPQGRNPEEWLDCYERLSKIPEIDVIGLSKLSIPKSFGPLVNAPEHAVVSYSRIYLTDYLSATRKVVRRKEHHLLGGDRMLPYELQIQSKYRWIRSNDSSAAVWLGAHGIIFNDIGIAKSYITRRMDFLRPISEDKHKYIVQNIKVLLTAAKGML